MWRWWWWEWWIDESWFSKSEILIDLFFINTYVCEYLSSIIYSKLFRLLGVWITNLLNQTVWKEALLKREHKLNWISWKERRFIWRRHSSLIIIIIIIISKFKIQKKKVLKGEKNDLIKKNQGPTKKYKRSPRIFVVYFPKPEEWGVWVHHPKNEVSFIRKNLKFYIHFYYLDHMWKLLHSFILISVFYEGLKFGPFRELKPV